MLRPGEPEGGLAASPVSLTLAGTPVQHPISVADILGRPGEYRDLDVRADLDEVGTALARLTAEPVRARLRAESVVEGVLVTGDVTGVAALECARCLGSRRADVAVTVCELFALHAAGAEEDAYAIDGTDIDLAPMLRDAVTLALPLAPLCRDDCAGLCARCGADLNEGACGCVDDDVDPRWAALAGLRDQLGD